MSSPGEQDDAPGARPAAAVPVRPAGSRWRRWWPPLKRWLSLVFFLLVAYLLFRVASTVDWQGVWIALRQRPPHELLWAGLLVAASYAVYSSFDLLGRHYVGHRLSKRLTMLINFISYAFNLNVGSLIGGVGFRYRLYSQQGLQPGAITRITVLSMVTNWLGYATLAGAVFWWRPLDLPPGWQLSPLALQLLGAGLLAVVAAYGLFCALARQRSWALRGHELEVPALRLAALQGLLSCTNWLLMASALYFLLQQKIDFPTVLSVLLIAAIAGVVTHIPAGLGVLEAVFVTLLAQQLPQREILAGLLAYRAMYYLAPLLIATLAYLFMEVRLKRRNAGAPPQEGV